MPLNVHLEYQVKSIPRALGNERNIEILQYSRQIIHAET